MPFCYLCNATLRAKDVIRREVHTGSASGQSSRGNSWARDHRGIRSICRACSDAIDAEISRRRKLALFVMLPIGLLITAVCLLVFVSMVINLLHNGVKL